MPSKIVIVGAGFVGLPAARRLKKSLGDSANITLIDEKDHFLFTPRLIDALAGDVKEPLIKTDLKLIADANDFTFLRAHVDAIDRKARRVLLQKSSRGTPTSIPYDILVLSEGARVCYFGIPGSEQHTFCLKRLNDVYGIHQRVHTLVKEALAASTNSQKTALLSFAVIGGGASGVESLIALKKYVGRHCDAHAPTLRRFLSFSLMEAGPQILNGFPTPIVHGTMDVLRRMGISVSIGEAVSCVEATCVTIGKRPPKPTALTIWAAGIIPNLIPIQPEVHRDAKGNLVTDRFLRIEPRIFAAGDATTHTEKNVTVPKNGQTALLMSRSIIDNILRTIRKQTLTPFTYRSLGSILWLGRTGFIHTSPFSIKTRIAVLLRDAFYRYRNWQITKH